MTVNIAPAPRQQFLDASGDPYSGAKLFTYTAGTTTKANTYTTSVGDVANTNPIVLDSSGRTPYGVWLTSGSNYKFVLAPSTDTDPPTSPIFTEDVIAGTNDTAVIASAQWSASAMTPTYIGATQFSVVGDQTTTLDVGRRCQFSVSAGTVYGHISVSVYTSLTTVTVVMDAGQALDSGLSSFNISILSGTNHSIPRLIDAKWTALGVAVLGSDNTHTAKIIMSGKAIDEAVHTEAAHATTSDIWTGGNTCLLSGAIVTFTDVADAPQAGSVRYVVANDAHIITDNAALEMDGNDNYTCAAGDVLRFEAKTTSTFRVSVVSTGDRTPKTTASATVSGIVELATEAEVQTGTDTARVPSVSTLRTGSLVLATMQASTSGTSIDFTSIPSWVKKITVMFSGVSTNGTSIPLIQIGDSGGIETSGYLGAGANVGGGGASALYTTGFGVGSDGAATYIRNGSFVLTLMDAATFLWAINGWVGNSDVARSQNTSGIKALTAALDRVRVTTVNGTDAFDAGNINILYE